MGKVKENRKNKMRSVKWSFLVYIPICAVLAYAGTYGIGIGSNHLQTWYEREYSEIEYDAHEQAYVIRQDDYGQVYYHFYDTVPFTSDKLSLRIGYWIVSWAQTILIPGWVLLCVGVTGIIFYRREMEKPITILLDASEKISENCLDFQMEQPVKQNELGELCVAFEGMRSALYQNNQEMWRMLEERRRLNAAFSHDMRTPITVLKGYADLLERYIPDGKISEEKLMEILEMMSGQITRLEHYTQKMSMVHKLEDLTPNPQMVEWESFVSRCRGIGDMIAGALQVKYYFHFASEQEQRQRGNNSGEDNQEKQIQIDEELVLEVYENLVSNAVRYAKSKIEISVILQESNLQITVADDGKGFTEEALLRAADPFFREEQDNEKTHFGLGLYISKLLCEKSQGELIVENVKGCKHGGEIADSETGGRVTAKFRINSR